MTCGEGTQSRTVTCEDNLGNTVGEVNCINAGLTRPDDTIMCFPQVCASYFVGQFGDVSYS